MEREEAELRALNQEEASLRAANKRITTMAEEVRKAELVRDRLEGLDRIMGSYPDPRGGPLHAGAPGGTPRGSGP